MKLLALITVGALGIVLLRRRRPDLAQRLEGAAKDAAGQLSGDPVLRADVRRAPLGGDDEVLPIRWSDNDQTIWPGETLTLTARYRRSDLRGATPVVTVAGGNVPRRVVAAPEPGG